MPDSSVTLVNSLPQKWDSIPAEGTKRAWLWSPPPVVTRQNAEDYFFEDKADGMWTWLSSKSGVSDSRWTDSRAISRDLTVQRSETCRFVHCSHLAEKFQLHLLVQEQQCNLRCITTGEIWSPTFASEIPKLDVKRTFLWDYVKNIVYVANWNKRKANHCNSCSSLPMCVNGNQWRS